MAREGYGLNLEKMFNQYPNSSMDQSTFAGEFSIPKLEIVPKETSYSAIERAFLLIDARNHGAIGYEELDEAL
jgi:Ca2+-binding EF-hand superfamily protein